MDAKQILKKGKGDHGNKPWSPLPYFISLSLRLFVTTLTLDIAISALAHIGVI